MSFVVAAIVVGTGATVYQTNKASKDAAGRAAQEAELQRQAEAQRLEQERAAAAAALEETRRYQAEQLALQREMQRQAEAAAAEQARIQREAFAAQQAAAEAEANRVRQAEERRQANITAGQSEIGSAFGQFDDNFYANRAKSYLDYSQPQLDTQYQDSMKSLTAALARSGNLNSSLRGDMFGKLQREYDTQKLSLADKAQQYANDARSNIERARSELTSTNATLADPGLIRERAQAAAASAGAAPAYSPLSMMLTDLASGVTPTGAKTTGSTASGVNLFNTSLTGGSGRVVS